MQDLPLSWLVQLLANIQDKQSMISLHGTCKLLQDMTLANAGRVQCLLDISTVTPTQAARSLQLLATCKEGAEVKLVLQATHVRFPPVSLLTWLNTLCTEYGSLLAPVTHIDVQVDACGDLMPSAISTCCPKMTHFTRRWWDASRNSNTACAPCQQLQHLTLDHFTPDFCQLEMQRQFSLLPNLQSLHCILLDTKKGSETLPARRLVHSMQPLYPFVKSLTLINKHVWLEDIVSKPWPQLQRLCVPDVAVYSRALELLLEFAPQVTDLEVHKFESDGNYADRSCKWRNLTAHSMTCDNLVKLPLAGLDTLRISCIYLSSPSWQHVPAAATVLRKIPRVEVVSQPSELQTGLWEEPCKESQLLALLQSLRQDQYALSPWGKANTRLLYVLGSLPCRDLTLQSDAILDSDWAELLQKMPALKLVHVQLPTRCRYVMRPWSVAELATPLITFCVHASRPCTLRVPSLYAIALGQDWQAELVASMQAAGHQHVTIEVVG